MSSQITTRTILMNEIKLFDYDKFVVKYSEENEDSLKKKKKKKDS